MASKATIGILSIGEMGLGVAKLLLAHNFNVVTSAVGRSPNTLARIQSASITNLPSDKDVISESSVILSIVPPRDAVATANRVAEAFKDTLANTESASTGSFSKIFIDLNAISPASVRSIASLFPSPSSSTDTSKILFLDGGIIGGPPKLNPETSQWNRPSLVISGPLDLTSQSSFSLEPPPFGKDLAETLNFSHVSPSIGSASGLKCSFAALTKGSIALSILSFTTASRLGVLPDLLSHLDKYSPGLGKQVQHGITSMPPKAYRWVDEMREIGKCFAADGGFTGANEEGEHEDGMLKDVEKIYQGIGEIYRFVSDGTILGRETTESRERGKIVEDVAECLTDGLQGLELKRPKTE